MQTRTQKHTYIDKYVCVCVCVYDIVEDPDIPWEWITQSIKDASKG